MTGTVAQQRQAASQCSTVDSLQLVHPIQTLKTIQIRQIIRRL